MALLQSKWRRSKCLSCSSFFVVASAPLIMLSLAPTFRYALPLLWNCSPSFVDDVHTVSFCRRCYMRCMHFFCQNSVPSTSSYPHASSKCKYVMQILYAYIICAGVCSTFNFVSFYYQILIGVWFLIGWLFSFKITCHIPFICNPVLNFVKHLGRIIIVGSFYIVVT